MILPELKLIDSYRTIKILRGLLIEVTEKEKDYIKGMKEYYKKIRKEVKGTDKKYKRIFKNVKVGKMEKFRRMGRYMGKSADDAFKGFRDKVYAEDQWQFWT